MLFTLVTCSRRWATKQTFRFFQNFFFPFTAQNDILYTLQSVKIVIVIKTLFLLSNYIAILLENQSIFKNIFFTFKSVFIFLYITTY